jgi:Tripartite tricarboxylate transporter TctB family
MRRLKALNKDQLGAILLIALGLAVLGLGFGYKMGNLNRMGAGFIPVVIGVLMVFIGAAIALTSTAASRAALAAVSAVDPAAGALHVKHSGPEWRGWICILGGVIAFVVFGEYGGLAPATFASVFVAALGDRQNNVKQSAVLAAALTVFCVVVFHFGLKLQLPLFQWGQ